MAKKSKFDYFDAFEKQTKTAVEQADLLVQMVDSFTSADELEPLLTQAHEIEHRGDDINHEVLHRVAVDFITPIERGDILELSHALDDIIDGIEDIMQGFYMYDVHYMHDGAKEFAKVIRKSTKALNKAMEDFRNFKKSKKLNSLMQEVNELEEQGDKLYMKHMRELFQNPDDPIEVDVWANLFDSMESVCDACEDVAEVMGNISLKNM